MKRRREAHEDDRIYRLLQRHLDRLPVGFPATRTGADLVLLRKLFKPDEARLALLLSSQPEPTHTIAARATPALAAEDAQRLLEGLFQKGAIGWKRLDGVDGWYLMPLVVGMYESQDGNPSRSFLVVADRYMRTLPFGASFLAVNPPQMRTIPINEVVTAEHHVATYDQIRAVVAEARGPMVVLPCICRRAQAIKGKPCRRTERSETCLGFGDLAAIVLRRNHGREVTRDEVLSILRRNEADGLVVQPANAQQPEFVCSCCGCCCGMLSMQKRLPHPIDFWTSNFIAQVDAERCSRCGLCVSRCQVDAVALPDSDKAARIHSSRCIGCGLCVSTCSSDAITLRPRSSHTTPPEDAEALNAEIAAKKKGAVGRALMLAKIALRMRQ